MSKSFHSAKYVNALEIKGVDGLVFVNVPQHDEDGKALSKKAYDANVLKVHKALKKEKGIRFVSFKAKK